MQLDSSYVFIKYTAKCKNRDIVINNKVSPNIIKVNRPCFHRTCLDKVCYNTLTKVSFIFVGANIVGIYCVINSYSDDFRYYSFGFHKNANRLLKIPAYYNYYIKNM